MFGNRFSLILFLIVGYFTIKGELFPTGGQTDEGTNDNKIDHYLPRSDTAKSRCVSKSPPESAHICSEIAK
jgi:hypothetical protein